MIKINIEDEVNVSPIVTGDGGPMTVLQASAVSQWKGAEDWDNSLMNGGMVETDYDFVCEAETHVVNRHDRDMLVLEDAEWGACLITSLSGEVMVLQCFGWPDEPVMNIVNRIRQNAPVQKYPFHAHDEIVRLMAGANAGNDSEYLYEEVKLPVGCQYCFVYETKEALLFMLSNKSLQM